MYDNTRAKDPALLGWLQTKAGTWALSRQGLHTTSWALEGAGNKGEHCKEHPIPSQGALRRSSGAGPLAVSTGQLWSVLNITGPRQVCAIVCSSPSHPQVEGSVQVEDGAVGRLRSFQILS